LPSLNAVPGTGGVRGAVGKGVLEREGTGLVHLVPLLLLLVVVVMVMMMMMMMMVAVVIIRGRKGWRFGPRERVETTGGVT
jgi:hypothetical protein